MSVRKNIDIPFDIHLPIVLDDSSSVFKYSLFSRGHHFYKDRWQPTVGDDSLQCEEEKDSKYDKHAVAIIYDSFHSNKVLRHVLVYCSKLADNFFEIS